MPNITTVTWKRSGVTQQTGISSVQFDEVNQDMSQFDHGATPYDLFNVFIRFANVAIVRGDQLVDENKLSDVYTVSNRPRQYPGGSCQLQATLPIGT